MTRHDCLRSTVSFLISKAASCPDVFTNANESLDVSFSEYFAEGGVEGHSVMFVTFSQQDDLLWVCLSTHPTKQQNPSMKGEKKKPSSVYVSKWLCWGKSMISEWTLGRCWPSVVPTPGRPRSSQTFQHVAQAQPFLKVSGKLFSQCYTIRLSWGWKAPCFSGAKGERQHLESVFTTRIQKQRTGRESRQLEVVILVHLPPTREKTGTDHHFIELYKVKFLEGDIYLTCLEGVPSVGCCTLQCYWLSY